MNDGRVRVQKSWLPLARLPAGPLYPFLDFPKFPDQR